MARINTSLASLQALRHLQSNSRRLDGTLERLSSGYRLNRVSDGAADYVVSLRLRNQLEALKQAAETSDRSRNLLQTADAALGEVQSLLQGIRELAVEAASPGGLAIEEIQANQSLVDDAIRSIERIASTAKFAGGKLLDGTRAYVTSGVAASVSELTVLGANFGAASQIQAKLRITQSAQYAVVSRSGRGTSAGSAVTLEVTGAKGTAVITIGASVGNSAIKAALNALTGATGVSVITSTTISGGLFFYSTGLGSDAFVSVRDLDQDGNNVRWINARDEGRDAAGTLNNTALSARGAVMDLDTTDLRIHLQLGAGMNKNGVTDIFTITGGGLAVQLGGGTAREDLAGIGLPQVTPSRLGDPALGYLNQLATGQSYDLLSDPSRALDILDAALEDVGLARGRLGAFTSQTLEANQKALAQAVEALTESESRLRDADFPEETANLARNQILVQAGTSILAQANVTAQAVLELLGPSRS